MLRTALALAACLLATAPRAEVPRVVTDIGPVQSLAAMVLGDLGEARVLLPAGASPHDHALRPSEARMLQDADLLVWIGPGLSPALEKPIATLASGAQVLTLWDVPGTNLLAPREDAVFAAEADHADHSDHGHDDHSGDNPHLWLDPANAQTWLTVIAEALAAQDPEHADTYRANAAEGRAAVDAAVADARAQLATGSKPRFVAFHDAYAYFEDAFGVAALGSVELGDATAPSPARLATLRDALAVQRIDCVLAEPQHKPGLIAAVTEGAERPVVIADPLGADLAPGAGLYPALIRDMARRFAACAAGVQP